MPSTLRRRAVALIALVAVVWASLWPLVSAAHAAAMHESVPLCHQAGMAVGLDELPSQPGMPSHPQPKFHCPLCIMAFYGGFSAPAVPTPPSFHCRVHVRDAYCAPKPAAVAFLLPQGRAPPLLA